jgi:hypothetical protein
MIISFALMQPDNAVFKTLEKITLTVHTLDSSTSPRSLKKLHDQLQRERESSLLRRSSSTKNRALGTEIRLVEPEIEL